MSRRPFAVAILASATLMLLGACSPEDTASSTTTAAEVTTTTRAPAELAALVEKPGPWSVGVGEAEVTGARDRTLPVQIWYPVDPDDTGEAEAATYPFPGLEVPSRMGLADAPPATGPFPLVVYSHGNGGLRYVSSFLTEHLASHGFVVVAPDHTGNTAIDAFAGTSDDRGQVALDRPVDVSATIDAVLGGDPGFESVSPQVDPDEVAVIGHSFGGFTALAVAGGLGEQDPDERVEAVVGLAAATNGLGDDVLEGVQAPTMLLWATDDATVGLSNNAARPDELVAGRPYVRADLEGAQHQSFTDVCDYRDQLAAMPDAPTAIVEAVDEYAAEGCLDGQMPIGDAHRMIKRLTTAFLLEQLFGDDTYTVLLESPTGDDPTLDRLERRD